MLTERRDVIVVMPADALPRTLHFAVGTPDELRALIARGVSLEARDEDGCTALFIAVMQADLSCVEILLRAGADPNAVAEEPAATIYADTPLNLANQARFFMSDERYTPVVELLKRFGAVDEHWA